MSNIFLSICIPTYNFGQFIGETLKSVINQINDKVEIIVLDGGSTDNTSEIVLSFQQISSRIIFHRLDKKGGIDKDIAKTVELARGEYCWLMSSDDAFKPGAIQRMLGEIQLGYDVYLCNRTDCDSRLVPIKDNYWLLSNIEDRVFDFSKKQEAIDYFGLSNSLGALFSYMSSIIFRRSKWRDRHCDDVFTGSNYGHVFRLFSTLQEGGTLKYIRDPLVFCRGENDSFLEQGLFRRHLIDFDGYHLLAMHLFPERDVRHAFLAVMTRHYNWIYLIIVKRMAPVDFDWDKFEDKLFAFGYTRAQLLIVRCVSSRILYPLAKNAWKMLHKNH